MKNYVTINNDYFTTASPEPIQVMTVVNVQNGQTLYVNVSEECMSISTIDGIRNTLSASIDFEDYTLVYLDCADWIVDGREAWPPMMNISEEYCQLFEDGLIQFMRNKFDIDHAVTSLPIEQMPEKLTQAVPFGYKDWLHKNELWATTDGYKIIVDENFLKEAFDTNGLEAVRLLKDLDEWMPDAAADDAKTQAFYDSKIQLIVNDKLYTFYNCAAVYNALAELAQDIIDEQ